MAIERTRGVERRAALLVLPSLPTREPIRLAMIEAFSGPFANTGEAVARNLLFAVERVNARGGVKLAGGARPLQLETFDSKGQVEEALTMFRRATDARVPFVLQGNSSAVAAALISMGSASTTSACRPGVCCFLITPPLSGVDQRALQPVAFSLRTRMSRCAWRRWSRRSRPMSAVSKVTCSIRLQLRSAGGCQCARNAGRPRGR